MKLSPLSREFGCVRRADGIPGCHPELVGGALAEAWKQRLDPPPESFLAGVVGHHGDPPNVQLESKKQYRHNVGSALGSWQLGISHHELRGGERVNRFAADQVQSNDGDA